MISIITIDPLENISMIIIIIIMIDIIFSKMIIMIITSIVESVINNKQNRSYPRKVYLFHSPWFHMMFYVHK